MCLSKSLLAHFTRKALGFLIFGSRQSHFSLSLFFFLEECNTFFILRKQEIERLLLALPIHDPICCLCEEKSQKMVLAETAALAITRCEHRKERGLVSLSKSTLTPTTSLHLKTPARTFTLEASSGPPPAVPLAYC